jgi:hypothetical protein
VIKTFIGDYKRSNLGGANDFAVLVLDSDLIQLSPAKLLSPEIETELVNARAEVAFHDMVSTAIDALQVRKIHVLRILIIQIRGLVSCHV